MSTQDESPIGASSRVLLRWSDATGATSSEDLVEILEAGFSKAILRSNSEIIAGTQVALIQGEYRAEGNVRACLQRGRTYLLEVAILEQPEASVGAFDPGVLAIEEFLTDEQEAKILKDLSDERSRIHVATAFSFN